MNRNVAMIAIALASFGLYVVRVHAQPDDREMMKRRIDKTRATLPRSVDAMTTLTGIELGDHVVSARYRISETFSTDPETSAAVRKGILAQACAQADARKALSLGWSLDNVYDVPTPHGPDQFHVLIKPADCG